MLAVFCRIPPLPASIHRLNEHPSYDWSDRGSGIDSNNCMTGQALRALCFSILAEDLFPKKDSKKQDEKTKLYFITLGMRYIKVTEARARWSLHRALRLPFAPAGSSWLVPPAGSSSLLLAPPASSWLVLAPCSSWILPAPPGSSWLVLAPAAQESLLSWTTLV